MERDNINTNNLNKEAKHIMFGTSGGGMSFTQKLHTMQTEDLIITDPKIEYKEN